MVNNFNVTLHMAQHPSVSSHVGMEELVGSYYALLAPNGIQICHGSWCIRLLQYNGPVEIRPYIGLWGARWVAAPL